LAQKYSNSLVLLTSRSIHAVVFDSAKYPHPCALIPWSIHALVLLTPRSIHALVLLTPRSIHALVLLTPRSIHALVLLQTKEQLLKNGLFKIKIDSPV